MFNFSAPQQRLAREPAALSWSSFCFWSLSCRLSCPVPSMVPEARLRPQPAPPLLTFLGVSAPLGTGPHTHRLPPISCSTSPAAPQTPNLAHSPLAPDSQPRSTSAHPTSQRLRGRRPSWSKPAPPLTGPMPAAPASSPAHKALSPPQPQGPWSAVMRSCHTAVPAHSPG